MITRWTGQLSKLCDTNIGFFFETVQSNFLRQIAVIKTIGLNCSMVVIFTRGHKNASGKLKSVTVFCVPKRHSSVLLHTDLWESAIVIFDDCVSRSSYHLTLMKVHMFVGWLFSVPATCECISGTDLLNFTCCHTEIEVADQTFHLTHSILTPGRPVPALTLFRQTPDRVATGVPIFKSLV